MKFTVEIDCDNAAFEGRPATEIARILRDIARRVLDGEGALETEKIRDINGNTVGRFGALT